MLLKLEVNRERMQENMDSQGGLIMAEKVMLDDKQTLRNTTKTAGLVSGSTGNSSGGN